MNPTPLTDRPLTRRYRGTLLLIAMLATVAAIGVRADYLGDARATVERAHEAEAAMAANLEQRLTVDA